MAGLTYGRHKLLEDLVEPLSVLGDRGTAADVQGELAQRENIASAVPVTREKTSYKSLLNDELFKILKWHTRQR